MPKVVSLEKFNDSANTKCLSSQFDQSDTFVHHTILLHGPAPLQKWKDLSQEIAKLRFENKR